MATLIHRPEYAGYDFGPEHPFTPARLAMLLDLIRCLGHEVSTVAAPAATREDILTVHDESYVAMVEALENLRLKLPKDPDGFTSYIDKTTHQIVQPLAIGRVVPNTDFPPAKVMLGEWRVYTAEDLIPPPEVVRRRRAAMGAKP